MDKETKELVDWFDELAMVQENPLTKNVVKKEPIIDDRIKNRLWKLNEVELNNLEESIKQEGCRESLILWGDILIDGHNRYDICKRNNIPYKTLKKQFNDIDEVLLWIDTNQLSRRNLTDEQRTVLIGRIYKSNKKQVGQHGECGHFGHIRSVEKIADELKISENTIKRAEKYVDAIEDIERSVGKETTDKILSGELNISKQDVLKISELDPFEQEKVIKKIEKGEAKNYKDTIKQKQIVELKEKELQEITEEYDVIVIDPAWPMEKIEREVAPNQIGFDYPTMSIEDIKNFKLPMADNCHVFLWTTQKFLPTAFEVLEEWGLKYVFTMVWHKNGGFQPFNLPQYNCEFILYGRKGSPIFTETRAFNTCFNADRAGHSVKPDEFYDLVRRITAGKRIDIFNRRKIEGFDTYGNEAE